MLTIFLCKEKKKTYFAYIVYGMYILSLFIFLTLIQKIIF